MPHWIAPVSGRSLLDTFIAALTVACPFATRLTLQSGCTVTGPVPGAVTVVVEQNDCYLAWTIDAALATTSTVHRLSRWAYALLARSSTP